MYETCYKSSFRHHLFCNRFYHIEFVPKIGKLSDSVKHNIHLLSVALFAIQVVLHKICVHFQKNINKNRSQVF